jgi:hypothetical protein
MKDFDWKCPNCGYDLKGSGYGDIYICYMNDQCPFYLLHIQDDIWNAIHEAKELKQLLGPLKDE